MNNKKTYLITDKYILELLSRKDKVALSLSRNLGTKSEIGIKEEVYI